MTREQQLLRDLIAIPSVNPAFLPNDHPWAGEERIANRLASAGKRAGLDVEFQEVFLRRSNLILRATPTGKIKHRVILAPHMDTVHVADEKQFQPRVRAGRMHGRGACDTKGSIAAMLTAMTEVANAKNRPRETEIILAALIDEENCQSGSRDFASRGIKADLAIVGEPTLLKVITAHKGDIWFTFETRGQAAHGSKPHLGKNAAHEMSRIVDLLLTKYAGQLRLRRHPVLGQPTISVGTIHSGTQPNIVPDQCIMTADRRTIPGENERDVRREIMECLKSHGLKATVTSSKNVSCRPLETSRRLPLVRGFLKIAGQRCEMGVDYFCDAAILSAGGIPSVVFGPGSIDQAHTSDEWISLKSLSDAVDLLKRFLLSLP